MHAFARACAYVLHGAYADAREQLVRVRVISFLPPYGSLSPGSGCQAWRQVAFTCYDTLPSSNIS